MNETYAAIAPDRSAIDAMQGPAVIEFGNAWCGHCHAAQPLIAAAMAPYPDVRHIKIADGPGQPLGRSFNVKLWPTLIFLDSGKEKSRLVRPLTSGAVEDALVAINNPCE